MEAEQLTEPITYHGEGPVWSQIWGGLRWLDMLAVDEEGGVWVARSGGGAVHRYTPDGTLGEVVRLPVTRVAACAFGGPGLDHLFITTSREHLDTDAEPESGALSTCLPGVRGMAVRGFAG